jgi:hypothetical protein
MKTGARPSNKRIQASNVHWPITALVSELTQSKLARARECVRRNVDRIERRNQVLVTKVTKLLISTSAGTKGKSG